MPAIKKHGDEKSLTVIDRMQKEVPTCRLDEPAGQIGTRAQQQGFSVCPVINEMKIVLGTISKSDWDKHPTGSAEQLMDPAPTTLRPNDALDKAEQRLEKSEQGAVLITDSDGKLLGAFVRRTDKDAEAGSNQQLPDSEVWS